MKKQTIVYIISYIDKAIAFEWIAERLSSTKYDLHFILLNPSTSFLGNYLKANNFNLHEISYTGKKSILSTAFKVYKKLRKLKPNIVHTHLVDADLIGLTVARVLGVKKRIYTRHNSNYHKKYHKGAEKFERLNNLMCTHVASISKNVSNILIEQEGLKKEKVRLVYHGFDIEKFQNVSDDVKWEMVNKYNPKEKGPVIGVISRYMHWKGLQHIIPAFQKLLKEYPNALLVLANAGKGDYKNEIQELLEGLPKDSYTEISFENNLFALYHLFDIFVHTPIDEEVEAFGQIYVEALAAGIPSIFTKSGIAREFITHKENALVVDFESSDQIYDSIKELLNNKELVHNLSRRGFLDVKEKFSLEQMINSLEHLYDE